MNKKTCTFKIEPIRLMDIIDSDRPIFIFLIIDEYVHNFFLFLKKKRGERLHILAFKILFF